LLLAHLALLTLTLTLNPNPNPSRIFYQEWVEMEPKPVERRYLPA